MYTHCTPVFAAINILLNESAIGVSFLKIYKKNWYEINESSQANPRNNRHNNNKKNRYRTENKAIQRVYSHK